jgi:hypothetical protein
MPLNQAVSTPRIVRANRRAFPRVRAEDLPWLARVRFLKGSAVSLLDLSVRGASFEVTSRLCLGDRTQLELQVDGSRTVASGWIVRSEVAEILPDAVRYRGACMFTAPLPWNRQLRGQETCGDTSLMCRSEPYEPWTGWSETMLVFRHGQRLSGFTRGFQGSEAMIVLWPSPTASAHAKQVVPLSILRAVCFTRDIDDNGTPRSHHRRDASPFQRVEVVFQNNARLYGTMPAFETTRSGFWLLPLGHRDPVRVFALSSAVTEIQLF